MTQTEQIAPEQTVAQIAPQAPPASSTAPVALLSPRSFTALEGARGYASLGILLGHGVGLLGAAGPSDVVFRALNSLIYFTGTIGTEWFFFLAGFVSYGVVSGRKRSWSQWMGSRLERLYPPFLLVELVYLAAAVFAPSASKVPTGSMWDTGYFLFANLFMLNGVLGTGALHVVTWTLGYNVLLYIFLPPLVGILCLRQQKPGQRLALLTISTILLFFALATTRHVRALLILVGILFRELHMQYGTKWRASRLLQAHTCAATCATIALLVYIGSVPPFVYSGVMRLIALTVLLPLLCVCALQPDTWWNQVCTIRPALWLGKRSYCCYLIHGMALHLVSLGLHRLHLTGLNHVQWAAIYVLAVSLSLTSAELFYRFVNSQSFVSVTARIFRNDQAQAPSIGVRPSVKPSRSSDEKVLAPALLRETA